MAKETPTPQGPTLDDFFAALRSAVDAASVARRRAAEAQADAAAKARDAADLTERARQLQAEFQSLTSGLLGDNPTHVRQA